MPLTKFAIRDTIVRIAMHELSIATRLVEMASELAQNEGVQTITSITLRIGALSCVHRRALEFSFEVVTENTPLEVAVLKII